MAKIKRNKNYIISFLLILCGLVLIGSKYFSYYMENKQAEREANDYIEYTSKQEDTEITLSKENYSYDDYVAVLEIPSISLKRGLFDMKSQKNNIKYNIQILNESQMPDVDNSLLILAGHSGTSKVSYFNNLHKVNNEELVYIYYNKIKYIYKITNIYLEPKDGNISIGHNRDKKTLVLTTCSKKFKDKQLVVISELIKTEMY